MNWAPNDLVSDADLVAYETNILTAFAQTDWKDKRRRALEDWLAPILYGQGYTLDRLRTRAEPDAVYGYTGSAYTDYSSAATSQTADDINLATVFATPASDALYIGSTQPFRGLSFRLLESVSSVTGVLSVAYWADSWVTLQVADDTRKTAGKSLSGGGAVTWGIESDWTMRALNSSAQLYWVKVTLDATPTGAKAAQIGVLRASALRAPATLRTLTLIMWEAPTGGPGPWAEKAARYESEADAALQRALQMLGGEFDTDSSDQVSPTEAAQTSAEVAGGWRMERA